MNVPQFLNVIYGNISLKNNIRITGLSLPSACAGLFGGPVYGIEGLRQLTGVYGRPLACTALKPLGVSVDELAAMAAAFARGGADLIKDDHGIGEQPFHPFTERVARCQEAVEKANATSGRRSLYFPMLWGAFDQLEAKVRFAVRQGVRGILIAPMLVGFDAMRYLSQTYRLAIMAHPACTGTFLHDARHGMTPAVLLGTLMRLCGADVSIFPNAGGRFCFSQRDCDELCTALRAPLLDCKAAFPCPAGGMNFERVGEMAGRYGADTVILIGGALMQHNRDDLAGATRAFMQRLAGHFTERLESPGETSSFASACEWRPAGRTAPKMDNGMLRFDDFHWGGSAPSAYKSDPALPFSGISRQELINACNSQTAFDLRYFEIQPGGFSSLEKHVHEHVIIAVRGSGVLRGGGRETILNPNDIAYTAPLQIHQLTNRGQEPFGFYCIVDRTRDRPMPPD
jgi:ribulose-bisphosphate carboxylase large chain